MWKVKAGHHCPIKHESLEGTSRQVDSLCYPLPRDLVGRLHGRIVLARANMAASQILAQLALQTEHVCMNQEAGGLTWMRSSASKDLIWREDESLNGCSP
jgi:hypothetical protein